MIVEIVMRSPASQEKCCFNAGCQLLLPQSFYKVSLSPVICVQELRGQLPLVELVEVPPPAGVNTRTNWKHGNTQKKQKTRVARPAPDCSAILAQIPKGPEGS